MKKNSKTIRKDYSKLDDGGTSLAYYGILMKNGRTRIDTKRYRKFFEIPDKKIEHRDTVYYVPTKVHRNEYFCNRFYDLTISLKNQWNSEYSRMIKNIKTPKEVEDDARVSAIIDDGMEYEDANEHAIIQRVKREIKYNDIIKTIYAQFYQQMMSQIDALTLRVLIENGYKNDHFSRKEFDTFIQGKQNINDSISFFNYKFYYAYDKAYKIWNFLKHNSDKAYKALKNYYSDAIDDEGDNYRNGNPAISVLKINDNLILKTLDELPLFFDEVCQRGFGENSKDARWDYDDYFINNVKKNIEK